MRNRKRKGYILILVIIALFLFSTITLYYVNLFHQEKALAQREKWNFIAEKVAEAGIEDAIYHLRQDLSWEAGFDNTKLPHSGGSYNMSFDKNQSAIPYSTNNGIGTVPVTGYGGREVPPGMIHLVSIGKYQDGRKQEEALVSLGGELFRDAVFVDKNIELRGTVLIDSFNSDNGPYSVTHLDSGGNVGTNSAYDGAVNLIGNVDIYGNVSAGPGATAENTLSASGNSSYQGFSVFDPERALPITTPPTGTNQGDITARNGTISPPPGTYTNLTGSGSSVIQLQPGTYVFTGDISISGQSVIELGAQAGRVQIYALGNISILGGGIVNNSQDPKNLIIFGGSETEDVVLKGGAESYFGIYAPSADIEIKGNSEIFGALVGDNLKLNGDAQIHFDTSMNSIIGGNGAVAIQSRW